jgi:formiminotetrahydrofolate cyclodeaminase
MSEPSPADSRLILSNSTGSFAELVAAGTPTPGGGSVAAYCGVLAASLGEMMCNITIGKQKYAQAEPRLREIKLELEVLGDRLRQLIAEDAESFEAVLRAYRLPKDSDEQKAERAAQIQITLRCAVDVPLETAQCSLDVLKLLDELAAIGTPNALSDVAVGAQLAQVAVRGASYNVGVNLDSLSDRDAADRTREQTKAIIERSKAIADNVEAKLKI